MCPNQLGLELHLDLERGLEWGAALWLSVNAWLLDLDDQG
jgi:hypothetical protein